MILNYKRKSKNENLYKKINEYIKNKEFDKNLSNDELDKIIDNLEKSMITSPNEIIIYRGLSQPPTYGIQKQFASCTSSLQLASKYGKYILAITLKPNNKYLDLQHIISYDKEIILNRNIYFEFIKKDGNIYYVNAQY